MCFGLVQASNEISGCTTLTSAAAWQAKIISLLDASFTLQDSGHYEQIFTGDVEDIAYFK